MFSVKPVHTHRRSHPEVTLRVFNNLDRAIALGPEINILKDQVRQPLSRQADIEQYQSSDPYNTKHAIGFNLIN
jgi:hypothetical protein